MLTSAILLLMGLLAVCNNTATGAPPAPTNQTRIQTPPQRQEDNLARIIKYCPPDTDSIAVLDLQRIKASKQFRTLSDDTSVVRFALATALEASPVIKQWWQQLPNQQLLEKIAAQTNRLVVVSRPGFLNTAIMFDGEYNENELLALIKGIVKQSGIESLKVDIRANYTEYSFGKERLFVIDGRIIMFPFNPEFRKFVTMPNDKAAENRYVDAVARHYASPNVLLAYAHADSDRRLHLFGREDKYEPKFDIHRGTLRDTGSALVLKMQKAHRNLALTKSSQAEFKQLFTTLAEQYQDLPIVGDLRQGTVTRDDTLITATVQTTGAALAHSKRDIIRFLIDGEPKAQDSPGETDKPVENRLEKKVVKQEPKKERFPYVFIPGKTKDLDEVRIYSGEITQSTKAERETFLAEIKEKKGVSYNFEDGYLSLKPKSDLPEFYKSIKESAIINMVIEDGNISSEEKDFIQKHTSDTYKLLPGESEDNSKKASPKEESSEQSKSHDFFDVLFGPLFESWKEGQIRKVENDIKENPIDITKELLEIGRVYFKNQGTVPMPAAKRRRIKIGSRRQRDENPVSASGTEPSPIAAPNPAAPTPPEDE